MEIKQSLQPGPDLKRVEKCQKTTVNRKGLGKENLFGCEAKKS